MEIGVWYGRSWQSLVGYEYDKGRICVLVG